jgi:hypothetical protein
MDAMLENKELNTKDIIKWTFLTFLLVSLSLIMDTKPLCPKELNAIITRKIMKTGDTDIKA